MAQSSSSGTRSTFVAATISTIQVEWVPLHEVDGVLRSNFLSQVLMSLGSGGFFSSLTIIIGAYVIPVAFLGILSFFMGIATYVAFVIRRRYGWKERQVPLVLTSSTTGTAI